MPPKTNYSNEELIPLLKQKNADAFTYLYITYYRSMYIIVKRIINDDEEMVKDVLQEGFLRIWDNIHQYNDDRCGIYNWMRIVVKNEAIQTKTREQKRGYVEKNGFLYIHKSGTSAIREVDSLALKQLVNTLEDKYRKIIELHYFEGYLFYEIFAQLNVSAATAAEWHRVALEKLRIATPELKTKIDIPEHYHPKLNWKDKCLYILNKEGPMYPFEVLQKAIEMEPGINTLNAGRAIKNSLYKLRKDQKLKFVEEENNYRLKYRIDTDMLSPR